MRPIRTVVALALALFFSAQAFAAEFVVPKQAIVISDGNDVILPGKTVPLGEMVDISVTKPVEAIPNLQTTSYEWKVVEQGKERKFKQGNGASNIWYAAGIRPKKQQVYCVISYLYVVREKIDDPTSRILEVAVRTQFLYVEVSVGDGEPEPITPVGPALPDGKYKLGKTAYDLVLKKVASSPDRVKAAKALATSFKGIASSISAGALKDPKDILAKTTSSNQTALANIGVDKLAWDPFFTDLKEAIYDLYEKDNIATAGDFAAAWNEIAAGLDSIK